MVNVRKRGNVYEYRAEIAPVDGKRKWISKSGFSSKKEAKEAGIKAYNEYMQTGHSFTPSTMSYSDYLDYWMKEHCEINLKQEKHKDEYGDMYVKHYAKEVENVYNKKKETKIINAHSEIKVALPEVHFVFLKDNGVFEGTDSVKYPFKVIHYELGIPCRFHDFRDTHATKLIESGADIKAISERLGHNNIQTTYEFYVRVTKKMNNDVVGKFEKVANL